MTHHNLCLELTCLDYEVYYRILGSEIKIAASYLKRKIFTSVMFWHISSVLMNLMI